MILNFKNKNVVIFGGSYGIGFAIVKGFLSEKANVHIISRTFDTKKLEALLAEYPESKIYTYNCDATSTNEIKKISFELLHNCNKFIDVLVLNIGNGKSSVNQQIIENESDWDLSWSINFNSVIFPLREYLDKINDGGVITIISSIAGLENIGAPNAYSIAKSSLITFSKNLAVNLAPKIRVNVIAPGNILTTGGSWESKLQSNPEKISTMLHEKVPLKRFGLPEEVSDLVVFVSSERASFITGACLVIDGGQTKSY